MRRASRMSTGERRAEHAVELREWVWFAEVARCAVERGRAGFEGQAAASKTWKPKHRDGGGGQAPEAAKRCASSRRALRATTVPVRMNGGVLQADEIIE
jgi:hypothetical protein